MGEDEAREHGYLADRVFKELDAKWPGIMVIQEHRQRKGPANGPIEYTHVYTYDSLYLMF